MSEPAAEPAPEPDTAQRDRLCQAMFDLVLETDYETATVPAVCERVGIDPAAFERHFADKADCCIQIYTTNNERFGEQVYGAYAEHELWRDSLRAAAYAAARFLAEHPREVRFNVIAILGAGPMAQARRDIYLQALVDLVDAGRNELDEPDSISRSVAEGVVGSIVERMLRDVNRQGDAEAAEAVVPELMYIAVRPYMGHEIARQELSIPAPPKVKTA